MIKKDENDVEYWRQLYQQQKGRAVRRNIPFLLSFEEFNELASQRCYYCGDLPLNGDPEEDFVYQGIDRVDNEKGYSRSNCVSCCKICNRAKGVMYFSGFLNHITKIYERHKDTIASIKKGLAI